MAKDRNASAGEEGRGVGGVKELRGEEPSRRERLPKAKRRKEESSSEGSSDSDSGVDRGKKKKRRKESRSRGNLRRDTESDSEVDSSCSDSDSDSETDSKEDSESDSELESESEEEIRRRRRKEWRRKERELEKEKRKRRRKEKERERRRKREKEERRKRRKERKKEKKKKKKEKDRGTKGAVTNSWGKYGVIKEIDMWNKRPEFTAWLAEVKQVNLETLPNWEEKQMFKEFMEDHNTATFPSKKYYDLDAYHRRKMDNEQKKGIKKVLATERTSFNDEEQRRLELLAEREKQKEQKVEALKRSMQSGMAQAMKDQARLREEMAYQYKLGNFEELKNAEKERMNKMEKFENKANLLLERQAILGACWSKKLLTLQGKLKGTEMDPANSHDICFSDFLRLLNSDNVHYIEYSNFGQYISVILPYNKDEEGGEAHGNSAEEVIYRRHIVDRMPFDAWNDVWMKLHKQIIHVDVLNTNSVSVEVYSTIANAVVWAMRFVLSVGVYLCIDHICMPIYAKYIPCDLGTPEKPIREFLPHRSLGSLGKSRAKFISAEETTGVTFADFAGQEYIKRELQEIVRILKNAEEFQDKGIYCPKGVLLHGPPGTGKTLLAKAIAGEAGLPFLAANGTDFVEMFVGVAAARVKDLFANARSFAPSIIFIDEIDAIGSKRGGPDIGGGGAEREQGLLQILTEMDGFKESASQVLVIGATNRLDILDPALLRKGRFDKIIRVGLPSRDGRLAILKVHARNKFFKSDLEKDALLEEIADLAVDFTGAELQNILNEAGILSARKDKDYIEREELLDALKRQKGTFETGQEDSTAIPEDLRIRLAYREAAVAVIACYYPDPLRPFIQTDISTLSSKPNMQYAEFSGKTFSRKSDYVHSIVQACTPRVIEEEMFGIDNLSWISAKATSEASKRSELLILQTGMTAFGKAYYRNFGDLVPNLAEKIEALRSEYMRFAVEKCTSVLREYRSAVETIADILLEKGWIKADEIWDIYKKAPRIPQEQVSPVDEYGSMIYAGRWGIYGISLPGRVTFAPGNVGHSTFGAPRPMETQIISDETWKLIDGIYNKRIEEIKEEVSAENEKVEEIPQLLLTDYLL